MHRLRTRQQSSVRLQPRARNHHHTKRHQYQTSRHLHRKYPQYATQLLRPGHNRQYHPPSSTEQSPTSPHHHKAPIHQDMSCTKPNMPTAQRHITHHDTKHTRRHHQSHHQRHQPGQYTKGQLSLNQCNQRRQPTTCQDTQFHYQDTSHQRPCHRSRQQPSTCHNARHRQSKRC